ncbi:uncharacterized protein LOC130786579 isoform X1 [Actinidia eriantha]|uniref:uncharacterized protein LOC130786579 isoform X1 n=1 Tax=Actinidia eriantha TaxID=165200 RepID=UPI002585AF9E|nr:uncharacterized protein LOC130786579 isoform X1 [Actinidia eriantha]
MAGQNQGGPNMAQFESFFQRADLDRDGRISGAEAVSFFQGSNLPQQVLAQIWMHADQARTGFLGRAEFYNALKLVTVAQSKRELTPDIVKAALHGPASAKIPAPQINLAAIRAPQLNSIAAAPTPQMGTVAPTSSQNLGFRGQVPPNATMNQYYYSSQGNQVMRPPLPPSAGNSLRPPQGVANPDFSTGGSVAGPAVLNSNIASDWLGGRTGGIAISASHVPNQAISQSMSSAATKPQDLLLSPSLPAANISKAPVGSANDLSSDMFSATQALEKHDLPTNSVISALTMSSNAPVPTGPQSSSKPDPFDMLQSTFTRQPTGNQLQPSQSLSKPNQQVSAQNTSSLASSGIPVGPGNSAFDKPQLSWPKMTPASIQKYTKVFVEVDTDRDGKITGEQARNLFLSWRLPREVLKQVWDLSDQDNDSMLSLREFCIALYLMEQYREGHPLPPTLPSNISHDETLLSLTGLRPPQGMPGVRPLTSAAGLRPPVPVMFPQADGASQFDQHKARDASIDSFHVNQLNNGEHNSADTKFQDSVKTEKKVDHEERVLLDSKEKIEFYRTKMQDLVLYKSRCDNRLNEITERALADKHEAELLGKKYEEKYKHVAETASKLTIEEAAFREIQERKMELHQAIIKMEQGGSADGILQVRADRIQFDLEELMKGLTERCKKHGIDIKSTAVIELPIGWQPGIPEVSSVWDEDWDKFEDEGFSFDVAMPPKTKSTSVEKENYSQSDSLSPDPLSYVNGTSEKPFNKSERAFENESPYTHSEDESGKSPSGSPVGHTAFESPSRDYSDSCFNKSPEADAGTHSSFDDSTWGTFDNNDDTDSVWGFNPGYSKGSDHERRGEKYFFESSDLGDSPRGTESPKGDNNYRKKSLFAFEDSVPGTPVSHSGNSPRHSIGATDTFFDNSSRFDSFNMHDHAFSPRRETLSRFDSVNSTRGFNNNPATLTRFDSANSTGDFDHRQGFSSFDDADPFGSSGPFKVSSESKKASDNWSSF